MLAQGHGPQVCAGVTAFNAAMGALLAAPARRPRRIDVSVHEAMMCLTETGALSGRAEGGVALRHGVNRYAPTYPCQALETADGWVGVTALTPQQWFALCKQIDRLDLAYGDTPRERLDLFLAADPQTPTLAFIHGGYWQMNDKENFAFFAEGLLPLGINVAVIEYTLAPAARLDRIVAEIRRSVR